MDAASPCPLDKPPIHIRALTLTPGSPDVTVLDKESTPAAHQTSHNSGVVHAGLYYAPGSAKARLVRAGVTALRAYCLDRGLPYDEVGKVLVALDSDDEHRLHGIQARAEANGVPGMRWLSPGQLREVEPHVVGRAALHSPSTAIVDYAQITAAMLADAVERTATVTTGFEVTSIDVGERTRVTAGDGRSVSADLVVVAGGLNADRLAALAGDSPFPRIVPFRGEFHELRPSARHLVSGLIYPVPDPRYPFLGVHLTKRVDGSVLLGPNAVLALSREGYRLRDIDRRQVRELLAFKGFRSFARANVATGASEVWGSFNRRAFIARARRYVPAISPSDVRPGPAGVRAQAMDADGSLVDDFRFSRVGNVFSIRNAPSPAATASLAIADRIVRELGMEPAP
ncbi:MAG: L-2-hydroxyglutarate oxidase [Humibacillus sp.]|nr:L-2-hydroxyglutarate oxidase [Humibacillus sp.]